MKQTKPVILVIDDCAENVEVLGKALDPTYTVLVALNGAEGVRLAAAENPDLILLDIMMPGMDGFEVCQKLKAVPKTERIPIIFVTAKIREEDEERGLELGAVDYIMKPISLPILKARVKIHIELKRRGDALMDLAQEGQRAKMREWVHYLEGDPDQDDS